MASTAAKLIRLTPIRDSRDIHERITSKLSWDDIPIPKPIEPPTRFEELLNADRAKLTKRSENARY